MNDYLKERETQRKRDYHRRWRAEHPESVRAAQIRYWAKKAAEIQDINNGTVGNSPAEVSAD